MKRETKAITVRLPEDQYVFLRTTAAAAGMSMSGWAQKVLSEQLQVEAQKVLDTNSKRLELAQRVASANIGADLDDDG